jgi:lysophospholipase L1-like esterase
MAATAESAQERLKAPITLLAFSLLAGGWAFMLNRASAPSPPVIVCFGDSLTACGGLGGRYPDYLAQELPGSLVINRGVGGDTLDGGRRRFERDVLALRPRVVVIALGANDFRRSDRPVSEMGADLEQMVRAARAQGCAVVIAGVFGPQLDAAGNLAPKLYHEGDPQRGQQVLEMERAAAAKYGCVHVENMQADLVLPEHWADARHPSATGNRLVAKKIAAALRALTQAQCTAVRCV